MQAKQFPFIQSGPKVLITGATGFVGKNLVRVLTNKGVSLRVLVRDKDRMERFSGIDVFQGDLTDPSSLAGIEADIDIVIHCAGMLGRWNTHTSALYNVNVNGTVHLLERFIGTKLYRFIHISAAGVTGPLKEESVDETCDCRPATAYEKTKYLGEQKVLEISTRMHIPVLVLRPTFVFGPGDPHKLALFKAVKKVKYAFIGNGRSVNSPVYIDDLIAGILLAIEKGKRGEVYLIGGNRPVTKMELIYTIADALGVRRPTASVPRWFAWLSAWGFEFFGRWFRFEPILTRSRVIMMADNYGYCIGKAMKELGYQPEAGLKWGIEKTVESYIETGLF